MISLFRFCEVAVAGLWLLDNLCKHIIANALIESHLYEYADLPSLCNGWRDRRFTVFIWRI